MARAKPPTRLIVRGDIWVECASRPVLTDAGADLLEQIEVCGSLSEAARRLRFAYRRAWVLVDTMNRSWPRPLVSTATGGKRGGGASLTDAGRHVLGVYRDVQLRLEHLLDGIGDPFGRLP